MKISPLIAINKWAVMPKVCEALGLDPDRVCRVILDFNANDPGPMIAYVEWVADEKFLELEWDLDGAKIKFSDKETKEADK